MRTRESINLLAVISLLLTKKVNCLTAYLHCIASVFISLSQCLQSRSDSNSTEDAPNLYHLLGKGPASIVG